MDLEDGRLGKWMNSVPLGAKVFAKDAYPYGRAEGSLLFSCPVEVNFHFLSLDSHQATLLGEGGAG